MKRRHSIARQAALRLVVSLGLLVLLIAFTSVAIYGAALRKAAQERAAELATFYEARIAQQEREWEIQALDFKVRLESTRMLEEPETAVVNLQAYLTVQGTARRFQYLLIESRQGRKLFEFGKNLSLPAIPTCADQSADHYLDPATGQLYRVFRTDIWLGAKEGMGRFAVFYRMDNALLEQIGSPGLRLTLLHDGTSMARAGDLWTREAAAQAGLESREIPWGDPIIRLRLEAPVKALFSTAEMSAGMSVIPLVDGLILWCTLGMWLLRHTRRISRLGMAVDAYATARRITPAMEEGLAGVRQGLVDDITEVADAVGAMVRAIEERERAREKSAEELRASEARLREVTSVLADGVLVVDREGLLTFVNPQAATLLGWSEAELLGRNSREILPTRPPEGIALSVHGCFAQPSVREGQPCRCELDYFARRDGSLLPVSVTAAPILRQETFAGAVVTFRDITEQLAAERALKESELRFRTLFNSSGDAILVNSLQGEGGGFGRFVEVNGVACQRLGYSREELLTMTPLDLDEPGTYAAAAEIAAFQAHLREAGHLLFERVIVAKDGRRIPVEINGHIFEFNDETLVLAVVRDISERKQAEQRLAASLAEKETLLKEVHHRVKNNMQIISSLLFLQARQEVSDEARKVVEECLQRVKTMSLIHEKLYRSKDLGSIDFADYLRNLVGELSRSYRGTGGGIATTISADQTFLPVDIAIPCGLITNELVTNAFKHAFPDRGKGGEIQVSFARSGEQLSLRVRDNGIGLPPDFAMERTESLGLSLVGNLARQLNGELTWRGDQGLEVVIAFAPEKAAG